MPTKTILTALLKDKTYLKKNSNNYDHLILPSKLKKDPSLLEILDGENLTIESNLISFYEKSEDGLKSAIGMAQQSQKEKEHFHVFILLPAASILRGGIWEFANMASSEKLSEIKAISITEDEPNERFNSKWKAAEWNTFFSDHTSEELLASSLNEACALIDEPAIIFI